MPTHQTHPQGFFLLKWDNVRFIFQRSCIGLHGFYVNLYFYILSKGEVSVTNMNLNEIKRTSNLSHTTAHQPQPRTCQWSEESLGSCAPAYQSINVHSSTSIKSIQSMDSRMNMYAHHVHILSFWTLKTWSMIRSPAKTVMMCNCHCQQNSKRNHLLYGILKIVHSLPEGWRIGFDAANERA